MNTSKISVRLDAEQRTAELELMTPHHKPRIEGLELDLRRLGLRQLHTIELSTPKYRVMRTKLRELDGSELNALRVVQILRAARHRELEMPSHQRFQAA